MPKVVAKLANGDTFSIKIEGYEQYLKLEQDMYKWWKRLLKLSDTVVVRKSSIVVLYYVANA